MVNYVSIVIIKDDKILTEYSKSASNHSLIYTEVKEELGVLETAAEYLKDKVQLKGEKLIQLPKPIQREKDSFQCILIDASKGEIEVKEDSGMVWLEGERIFTLGFFETAVIKLLLEQCIKEEYVTLSTSALEKNAEKAIRLPNYFSDFRGKWFKDRMDQESGSGKKLSYIAFSLIAGLMYALFFYKNYKGVSHIIFTLYLSAVFLVFNKIKTKSLMGIFLLACSMLLSLSYSVFTNPIFRALNIVIIPLGLFSSFLLLTYPNIILELNRFTKLFLSKVIGDSISTSVKLPVFIKNLMKDGKKSRKSEAYRSVAIGLAISVPVVIVLCMFLAGADGMFNYYLSNLGEYLRFDNLNGVISRVILTLIIFFFLFGFYWSLGYGLTCHEGGGEPKKIFQPITVATLVGVVNILYLVFTNVQVSYLYGGKQLPSGFTHAEYARNGFFQLVFIVLLNVLAITILKLKTKDAGRKLNLTLSALYTTITLFTLNMSVSALYKMNLYIAAFGYTRLRLLVQAFTVFLAFVVVLLIAFIWKKINLFKPILICAAVIYVTLNFVNIDNFILKRNITVTPSETKFDENYASILSADAYEAINEAFKSEKISKEKYNIWVNRNRESQDHWYEYNYYASKIVK